MPVVTPITMGPSVFKNLQGELLKRQTNYDFGKCMEDCKKVSSFFFKFRPTSFFFLSRPRRRRKFSAALSHSHLFLFSLSLSPLKTRSPIVRALISVKVSCRSPRTLFAAATSASASATSRSLTATQSTGTTRRRRKATDGCRASRRAEKSRPRPRRSTSSLVKKEMRGESELKRVFSPTGRNDVDDVKGFPFPQQRF